MVFYFVEIRGKESLAALYKTIEHSKRHLFCEEIYIIPVEIKAPIEYNALRHGTKLISDNIKDKLKEILKRFKTKFNSDVYDTLFEVMNASNSTRDTLLWCDLCSPTKRYVDKLGTTCPCIGCGLYFYIIMICRIIECLEKVDVYDKSRDLIYLVNDAKVEDMLANEHYKKLLSVANYGINIEILWPIYDTGHDEIDFAYETMCNLINQDPASIELLLYKCPMVDIFKEERSKNNADNIAEAIDLNCIPYASFISKG